mmetsp:Transcript_1884/g.5238  ORF Transcript_1884/g.5238 Transcript_1884/m.5238 type:complete len:138 (-) Transcript_1884:48-461(-)
MAAATRAQVGSTAREAIAKGIVEELSPLVTEFDEAVGSVQASQKNLLERIDRISAELERVNAAGAEPGLGPYVAKLVDCRKRLRAVSASLDTINDRLDFMHDKTTERLKGKAAASAAGGAPGGESSAAAAGDDEAKA